MYICHCLSVFDSSIFCVESFLGFLSHQLTRQQRNIGDRGTAEDEKAFWETTVGLVAVECAGYISTSWTVDKHSPYKPTQGP